MAGKAEAKPKRASPFCTIFTSPAASRRHRLRGSTAIGDFLLLPALAGLGVLLAAPAAAQTLIGTDVNGTVQLSDAGAYPAGGPFTIAQGVTISTAAANTVSVLGTLAASLSNDGAIMATGHEDTGIGLNLGGSISNTGAISATNDGIHTTNAQAAINNAGLITAGYDGISLDAGGTVSNANAATITGYHIGLYTGASASTVSNSGTIAASFGDGVSLYQGGSFSNTASGIIHGGYAGVYLGGSGFSMQNAGSISGADYGVLLHGNTLENDSGGIITGGSIGVYAGSGAMVSNAGLISGTIGLEVKGTGATILNTGTIASTAAGGDAISFNAQGLNTLILGTGAVINGAIDGGGSASSIDLTGTGLLASTINNFGPGSDLTVETGADWSASGSWSIATLTNAGTFQPGNLTTPLLFTGDYAQAPNGTMRVIISPADSSHFIITGTAHLAGDLVYVFAPGSYKPRTYNFITATGGITGNFADPVYDGPPPLLGNALNNDALNNGPELVLQNDEVVNPRDASLFSAALQAQAVTAQAQNTILLARAAAPEAQSCVTPLTTPGSDTAAHLAGAMADAFCMAGGWMQASFSTLNIAASNGAPDNQAQTGGFLAGIDRPINVYGTRLGLAVGYDENWLHDNAAGKANTGTTRIGLYAAQPIGQFTLAADILYGHADTTTTRLTGAGATTASFGSDIFSAAIQANTAFYPGGFTLTPAAGLAVSIVNSSRFTEHGSGAAAVFAITGAPGHEASVQPFINLTASHDFFTGNAVTIIPQASIGYTSQAGDRGKTITLTALDSTSFAPPHNNLTPSTATLSAGLTAAKNNFTLYAHYTADLSGNWTAQSIQAGLQLKF